MRSFLKKSMSLFAAGLCAAAVLLAPARAAADDSLHLKDGRVLTGEIVRELDGHVWLKFKVGGVEQTMMFSPGEITKVERDAKPAPVDDAPEAAAPAAAAAAAKPRVAGVPRAAVLTLGGGGDQDMVGLYMTAESIRRAIPALEAEGVEIVVLRINSGGGALLEIQRLSDVIHEELKPKFRVVSWIQWAISAAAMTSHCVPEIYFTTQGAYGACTGWYGALTAVAGRDLEDVLYMMERISARGGYDPMIMRSMQIMEPLSATIDGNGHVAWYQNLEGESVVNPSGKILTFDSGTAAKFKFSKGTADTLDELARAMGLQEVEWVGEHVDGIQWPVCAAERMQMDFRRKTHEDTTRLQEYWDGYQTNISVAQSIQDKDERGPFVGKARQHFEKIKKMVKNNPNLQIFIFGMLNQQWEEWVEVQERLLRDLMR